MTITFRPAVVIGLGGMGTAIALRAKKLVDAQLERQVELGLLDEATRQAAIHSRFKFIGIDSNPQSYAPEFTRFIHLAQDITGVDRLVDAFERNNDGFGDWYPAGYRAGDFIDGVGHVRVRGRLAYTLTREPGQVDIPGIIGAQVADSLALLDGMPLAAGSRNLPVFICTSLSGGTGSGIFLSILKAIRPLRSELQVWGIVVDDSIAELGAAVDGNVRRERANFFTGLLELDAWMDSSGSLRKAVGWDPFWPGTPDPQAKPPADLIWLYDMVNNAGLRIPTQQQAMTHVADTVASWIHSSSTESVASMGSDVMAWVANHTGILNTQTGRPALYGAMGVAHLEYPASRIATYLGAELVAEAVRQHLLPDPLPASTLKPEVDAFLSDNDLRVSGADELGNRLKKLLPPAPGITNALQDRGGARNQAEAVVRRLTSAGGRSTVYLDLCDQEIAACINGADARPAFGSILDERLKELLLATPDGLPRARAFLAALTGALAGSERELAAQNRAQAERSLQNLRARYSNAVNGMVGKLPFHYESRVTDFETAWWKPYVLAKAEEDTYDKVLRLYDDAVKVVETRVEALDALASSLQAAAADIARQGRESMDFGTDGSSSLTEFVLTDRQRLRSKFRARDDAAAGVALAASRDQASGLVRWLPEVQAQVLADRAGGGRGANDLALLARRASKALEERLLQTAKAEVEGPVRACTIWDALKEELIGLASLPEYVAYLGRRVHPLVQKSQPMFPVDVAKLGGTGASNPERSIFVVMNEQEAASFGDQLGAQPGWLGGVITSQLQNARFTTVDTPDPHRITIAHRIVGFPLFAMHDSVVSRGKDAVESLNGRWHIWSDVRASRLPRTFDPIDFHSLQLIGSEPEYIAGLALGWGTIVYPSQADGRPNRGVIKMPPGPDTIARGLKDLMDQFRVQPQLLTSLKDRVQARFHDVGRGRWVDEVQRALDNVRQEYWDEPNGTDRKEVLQSLFNTVELRLKDVKQRYNPDNPTTDLALDDLLPGSKRA